MSTAAEILVIILSAFLAFFLLLSIILTIKLIKLAGQAQRIANKVEDAADSARDVVQNIKNWTSPALFAGAARGWGEKIKGFFSKRQNNNEEGE